VYSIGIIPLNGRNVAVAVNCAVEVGGCSFVKQLQEEEGQGDGGACGCCCCIFSVRQQRRIVQYTFECRENSNPGGRCHVHRVPKKCDHVFDDKLK